MSGYILKVTQVVSGGALGYLIAEYMPWQVVIVALVLYLIAMATIAYEAYQIGAES